MVQRQLGADGAKGDIAIAHRHRPWRQYRLTGAVVILILLALLPATGCAAQDEHNRRFAMELAVISGDLRLLREGGMAPRHRRGLVDRITSALGYLGLLARQARQTASGARGADPRHDLNQLRRAFFANDLPATAHRLQRLMQDYPLDIRGFIALDATPARLERGRKLYRDSCRACHIAPDRARDNPARNLFIDAATMPEQEFIARLLAGVRGLPQTGLENPLADEQLRSLLAWFRHGTSAADRLPPDLNSVCAAERPD